MKKTALIAVLLLTLGGARLEAGSAVAGDGARIESDSERAIVRFKAIYDNPFGGRWNCMGYHITSDTSRPSDREECTFNDLSSFPPGIYEGDPFYIINGVSYTWFSDYDGVTASYVRFIVTDNGDGTGHAFVTAVY